MILRSTLTCLIAASLYAAPADAPPDSTAVDLSSMSIEQLMDVSAASILKRPEKPSQTPVAIFILTEEDIRRSGMTSIPELLRLVPGMDVARQSVSAWGISARGLANLGADKMLVLIDGRRVYDPLIAGVFWDAQDMPLYDIAQIEVLRGPGSSLWGADAVNGVINIITKSASQTQGLVAEAGGGNLDGSVSSAQFGGKVGQHTYYRIFGKYDRNSLLASDATPSETPPISTQRAGFRVDTDLTKRDSLTVEGDFYSGTIASLYPQLGVTAPRDGGDVLTRWTHRLANGSETSLQIYWDNTNRSVYNSLWLRNTFDLDFEHQLTVAERHNLIWGVRADFSLDRSTNSSVSGFIPASFDYNVFDAFVQDDISFGENKFHLVAGSKFEHNDYTGFEWQPNLRLAWTPDARQTVWAAVSRGVVVPSRDKRSGYLNLPAFYTTEPGIPPVAIAVSGSPDATSEDLVAYEVGYRTVIRPTLSFDLTGFYNVYDHLATNEVGTPYLAFNPNPYIVQPVIAGNMMRGQSRGMELSSTWKPLEKWKITGSYSFLNIHLQLLPGSTDASSLSEQGESPQHQFQMHSYLDLRHGFELDAALYYTSALPTWNIAPYARFDLRAGWRPERHTEFSLVGQNLLANRHLEALSDTELPATSIRRSIYAQVTWRFF